MTVNDQPITIARRYVKGRAHFAQMLAWWLDRSSLSYKQVSYISDWCLGETSSLPTSQISHLRRAGLRNPNFKLIECFYGVNLAIYEWHTKGHKFCYQKYGPLPSTLSAEVIDTAIWLPLPDNDEPLQFHDWVNIFSGRLTLDYVGGTKISESEENQLNEALSKLLMDEILQHGNMRIGIAEFLKAYPTDDPSRMTKMRQFITGQTDFTSDEIQYELAAIAGAIERMRDLEPGTFRAPDLYAELVKDRRRT